MIRILIADSEPYTREQLRSHLVSDAEVEITGMARDGQEALQLAHQLTPDITLVAANLAVMDGFKTIELITASNQATQCILVSDTNSPEQLRRAMRAGAREFLAHPVARETLLGAIREVYAEQQKRMSQSFVEAANPDKVTRLISISGAKGGIGKTTLITNLAVAVAEQTQEPTLLLDLYTQFGDVPIMLNLTPRRALIELASLDPASMDAQLLEDCMDQHDSGLRVLTTSKTPVALDALTVPILESILRILKQRYRYILVDVPPILHSPSLYIVSHATTVLVIANLFDITTIHDTKRLLETLEGKYTSREKIKVIVNRVARQNRMQLADIEEILGFPIEASIPNDGEVVPGSVNQGVPFVQSHPNSAIGQSVRQLARRLAGDETAAQEVEVVKPPTAARWFGWLFGRDAMRKKAA
ncbi:MAG TPA: response regulator [Chthonomonadaceae bacterium]|nr:response regulator [Chthonomonadaceae bacterium]